MPEGILKETFNAADQGNWQAFITVLGGATCPRKSQSIKLTRQWDDNPNKNGDPKGEVIIGVEHGDMVVMTREHQWRIESKEHRSVGDAALARSVSAVSSQSVAYLEFCQ